MVDLLGSWPETADLGAISRRGFLSRFAVVKQFAALARSKGILLVVDGAHPLGRLQLNMHDLGVDYYATSPHKWLDAPTGTGLLYMRREAQDRVWPTIGGSGWDDPKRGAARFDRLSQDFQNAIGRDRIEQRVRALHASLRSKVQAIRGVTIYTSAHAELCCGLLGFTIPQLNNRDIVETLHRRHHVWVRSTDYGLNTVRVSTHYYNTEEQVDRLVEGLNDILKNGVIPAPPPSGDDDD